MTHDLISEMLSELEVSCTRVAVTELRENTFYAEITLQLNGREMQIDSRPSDALALAVRTGAPIFAAEDVISESAIEFEHEVEDTEEVVEKFKDFLDNVTPEDFAGGDEPEAARASRRAGLGRLALERQLQDPLDQRVERDARRLRGLRQQARLRQPRDRVGLEHRELAGRVQHQVDPARSRSSPAAGRCASASSWAASVTPAGSSAGQTKSVRPIS